MGDLDGNDGLLLQADEVKRLLRSDKVGERKKARDECMLLINADKENQHVNNFEWSFLVKGALVFENNEILYARNKFKEQAIENAQFLKKLVKHCVFQSQITSQLLPHIFKHVMQKVYDEHLSPSYVSEHKQILIDLLDLRVAHFFSTTYLADVFTYLQQIMVDKRSIANTPDNQKLFRAFSKALFSEKEECLKLVEMFLEWSCQTGKLFDAIGGDSPNEATLTVLMADCLTILVEYHGESIASVLFRVIGLPLQMVMKLLATKTGHSRDAYRDPCLRFLFAYFQLSTKCHYSLISPFCTQDPLGNVLSTLYDELSSDECLRALVVMATNVSINSRVKDMFVNVLDDAKVRLRFDVTAICCCMLQLQSTSVASSARAALDTKGNLTDFTSSPSAKRRKTGTPGSHQSPSSISALQLQQVQNAPARATATQSLLRKIQHGASDAGAGVNPSLHIQAMHGTQRGNLTQNVQNLTQLAPLSTASSNSKRSNSVLFEGFLLVAISLARCFPRGEFLLSDADFSKDVLSRNERLGALCEWVCTLRIKAVEALYSTDEMQIHGSLLIALRAFARVSAVVIESSHCSTSDLNDSTVYIQQLRREWSEVVRALIQCPKVRTYFSSCRKMSIAETVCGLFETIFELNLPEPAGKTSFQQSLWNFPPMYDPRLVDSPAFFSLLAGLMKQSNHEIPKSLCQVYTKAQDSNEGGEVAINEVHGSALAIVYLSCWIESQAEAHATSRLTLAALPDLVSSVSKVVKQTLSSSPMQANSTELLQEALSSRLGCSFPISYENLGSLQATAQSHWFERNCTDAVEEEVVYLLGANILIDGGNGSITIDTVKRESSSQSEKRVHACDIPRYMDTAQLSLQLLDRVHCRIVSKDSCDAQAADSADTVSNWHFLSLLLCTAYMSLVENLEEHYFVHAVSTATEGTAEYLQETEYFESGMVLSLHIILKFWSVLRLVLKVIIARSHCIKCTYLSEYFQQWSVLMKRLTVSRLFHFQFDRSMRETLKKSFGACFTASNTANTTDQRRLLKAIRQQKEECSEDLLTFGRFVRDSAIAKKQKGADNGSRYADPDGMDIRATPSGRQKNALELVGRHSGTGGCSDDEDFLSAPSLAERFKFPAAKVSFTSDQQRLFVQVANCYFVSVMADSVGSIQEERLQSLCKVLKEREIGHGNIAPVCTPSETMLIIAESLAAICASTRSQASSIIAVSNFMVQASFDIEWGCIGYYKALCIICDMSQRPDFFLATDQQCFRRLQTLVRIVFCEGDAVVHFPRTFWRCRWMQIECIANLIRFHKDYSAFLASAEGKTWHAALKNKGVEVQHISLDAETGYLTIIKTLLLDYMNDINHRVRMTAARVFSSLLLPKWKHPKIYESMLESTGISPIASKSTIQHRESTTLPPGAISVRNQSCRYQNADDMDVAGDQDNATEDPLMVVSTAFAIVRMAVASPHQLLHEALIDLCHLCCSRSSRYRSEKGVLFPCYISLLKRLLFYISIQLEYKSPAMMLVDYFRILVMEWLQPTSKSSEPRPDSSVVLKLSDFPFFIMQNNSTYSYADFLLENAHAILPLICRMEDHRARWAAVRHFGISSAYGDSDSGLAKLFSHYAPAIWGCEYQHILQSNSANAENAMVDGQLEGSEISSFLSRIIPSPTILDKLLLQGISDIVQELACSFTYSALEIEGRALAKDNNQSIAWLPQEPMAALQKQLEVINMDLIKRKKVSCGESLSTSLDRFVNLVEVLAALRRRLTETRIERIRLNILSCVGCLMLEHSQPKAYLIRAFISVILTALQSTSHYSVVITSCQLLQQLVERWNDSYLDAACVNLSPELLSELISLHHALRCALKILRKANSPESDVIDVRIVLVGDDDCTSSIYATLLHAVSTCSKLEMSHWQRELLHAEEVVDASLSDLLVNLSKLTARSRPAKVNPAYRILPLPRIFSQSLSPSVKSALEDLEEKETDFDFSMRMQDFIHLEKQFLNGIPVSVTVMWVKLCCLYDRIVLNEDGSDEDAQENDAGGSLPKKAFGAALWRDHGDLVASFVASVIRLCKKRTVPSEAFRRKIMSLLGHLGSPDLLSMQHSGSNGHYKSTSKHQIPLWGTVHDPSPLEFNEGAPTICSRVSALFVMVTGMLWEDSFASHVASTALRAMSANRCLEDPDMLSAAGMLGAGELLVLYRTVPLTCRLPSIYPISPDLSKVGNGYGQSGGHDGHGVDAWSPETWNTAGKKFSFWVSGVVVALLRTYYSGVLQMFIGPQGITFTDNENPEAAARLSAEDPRGLRRLLSAITEACHLRYEIAAAAFPLILYDLLSGQHAKVAREKLSEHLSTYVLHPSCGMSQATRLGCSTLVFLLRQEINSWRIAGIEAIKALKKGAGKKDAKTGASAGMHRKTPPYGYSLNIDYHFAANAAERSGCVCTALIFAELAEEEKRGLDSYSGCSPGSQSQEVHPDRAVKATGLLVRIYKKVHDPDAILGMMHAASNLEVQASLYSHSGSWIEALATYESMIITSGSSGSDESYGASAASANIGIAQSLRGLGAQHVLSAFASAALQSQSGGHSNLWDEMSGLASESVWRSPLVQAGPSLAQSSADAALRQWSPSLAGTSASVYTLSRGRQHSSTTLDSMALERPVLSERESPSYFSAASLLPSDFFNDSIGLSIRDISRRDLGTASSRLANCAQLLFPQIAESLAHETAHNLLPDLVKAQQLVEVLEAGRVMIVGQAGAADLSVFAGTPSVRSPMKGRANGDVPSPVMPHTLSINRNSLLTAMISKWRGRLGGINGSALLYTESVLSLRLALVTQLLHTGGTTPEEAMGLMNQIHDVTTTRGAAHALSPLVYQMRNALMSCAVLTPALSIPARLSDPYAAPLSTATHLTTGLKGAPGEGPWRIEWSMHEAKLLWKKGLQKVALGAVDGVISKIKDTIRSAPAGVAKDVLTSIPISEAQIFKSQFRTALNALLSDAYVTCGEWLSSGDCLAATGGDILTDYLLPAVQSAQTNAKRIQASLTTAGFYERLFQQIKAKFVSPEWKQFVRNNTDRRKEYEQCMAFKSQHAAEKAEREKIRSKTPSKVDNNDAELAAIAAREEEGFRRHMKMLKSELDLDEAERRSVEDSIHTYLHGALKYYSDVLELSLEADVEVVFRVVNLWFNNRDDVSVNETLDRIISKTASFKFVPLTYQILSRLGAPSGATNIVTTSTSASKSEEFSFSRVHSKLVLKLCCQHPHHVLPQLLCLVHSEESGRASPSSASPPSSRSQSAFAIISKLRSDTGTVKQVLGPLEKLLQGYIDLALVSTETQVKANKLHDIPLKDVQPSTGGMKPFDQCLAGQQYRPAVLTVSVPLSPSGDYANVPRVYKFHSRFSLTDSGISHPKIIKCEGDDGRVYKQLVKGGDDMRQDAVMQQVFENVNYTLSRVEETRKRQLSIRTYKIIPMTPQTGVIEYVENTEPFGNYLTHGPACAHVRYYPQDWTNSDCRAYLASATDQRDREARYREITAHFHPAFRFFFLEKYPDPSRWMNCRLAYTRSVAVNSIVGYILGIGDRHSHNILIDSTTAEVVHIDFGIVFEQGKVLQTPETVPFRLTRDIVDGMGVTGCEGSFRRSCEEVLRVLRGNTQQLMTILEVVLHDPLYKWSLSPIQARAKQEKQGLQGKDSKDTMAVKSRGGHGPKDAATKDNDDASNKGQFGRDAAERTLMRIKSKLQGFEDPTGEGLGVEGQVELIISTAKDPRNLAKLFQGWAAWV